MQTQCPLCNKNAGLSFVTKDYNRKVSQATFSYRQCSDCGLFFLSNIPDDLDAYYGNDYYCTPSFEKLKKVARIENYQMAMISRFVKSGRLLEVGPGFGVFAYQAKQAGFDVDVIEKEERCCKFLFEIIGVRAIRSDAPHKAIESAKGYDVIALWHVIEHLPRPWEFLTSAAKNLNPNGILLIATPNPSAFQFRFQGARWPHIDAPRHLCLISAGLLAKYLEPFELKPVMTTFDDRGARSWNIFGWQRYLMNNFSNRWFQSAAFVLGHFVAVLMRFFDCRRGRGSAYTIIFQKMNCLI